MISIIISGCNESPFSFSRLKKTGCKCAMVWYTLSWVRQVLIDLVNNTVLMMMVKPVRMAWASVIS